MFQLVRKFGQPVGQSLKRVAFCFKQKWDLPKVWPNFWTDVQAVVKECPTNCDKFEPFAIWGKNASTFRNLFKRLAATSDFWTFVGTLLVRYKKPLHNPGRLPNRNWFPKQCCKATKRKDKNREPRDNKQKRRGESEDRQPRDNQKTCFMPFPLMHTRAKKEEKELRYCAWS